MVFLLCLVTPVGQYRDDYQVEQKQTSQFSMSYEEHSTIEIISDGDFAAQASSENWDGDGSFDTPYIIEGYNITDDNTCIQITDVSVYFIIRNCFINSSTGPSDPGIYLYNAPHARVENTIVTWHTYAIYAQDCPDIVIDNCLTTQSFANTIWIITSDRAVLSNCQIYDNGFRVYIQSSDNATIYNNEIHDNYWQGLMIETSDFLNISSNTVENNGYEGIRLDICNNATIYDNDIGENGYVDGNKAGLYLSNVEDSLIEANRVWNNSQYGISLETSSHNWIKDNEVFDDPYVGIYGHLSIGNDVTGNYITDNGWTLPPYGSGIYTDSCQYWSIEENQIYNNGYTGIHLMGESDFNEIKNNQIFNSTMDGIYGNDAYHINVTGNDIWYNGGGSYGCGIYVDISIYWQIEDNRIWDNIEDGIHFEDCDYCTVLNNEIWDNWEDGIEYISGGDSIIQGNTIHHNEEYGIDINLDSSANITDNLIYDNAVGIGVEYSGGSWVYGNDIGWNYIDNAICSSSIYWDDNVSIGNHWSDYSGQENYTITAEVAYDCFPEKSLDLNASSPIAFEMSETGNTMLWEAYALHPSHYEVYANDTLLYSEVWDGNDIITEVDGLLAGDNEIMVIAYHISGHSINASAFATVTDLTAPTWVSVPVDQDITVGESFSYQVTAIDSSGISGYAVNDTVHFQISDTGLITNKTDLDVGRYYLEISVWDNYGNALTHVILIEVHSATTTPVTTPTNGGGTIMLLAISIGAGAIVVVIVLVAFKKKK